MALDAENKKEEFEFPKSYNFPPFFSPQPTALTRQAQLLVDNLDSALFHNAALKKRLPLLFVKEVIDFMASKDGDERAEWLSSEKSSAWIWWRKADEWANQIASWVEETGQKGVVLTLYELVESDATQKQEFHGLDMEVLQKSLSILIKKGKAQVFGTADQQGVKFF